VYPKVSTFVISFLFDVSVVQYQNINMTTKRAITYIRASLNEDRQQNSHDVQRAVISAFATRHHYDIEREFSEYRTGTDDSRPEFNKALEYARSNNCYLLIYRLDRCARTLTAFSLISDLLPIMRFTDLGDTEPNLMIIGCLLSVAAQESINTSVRLKATIKHLREQDPTRSWGNPNFYLEQGDEALAVRQSNASTFNARIKKIVADLELAGYNNLDSQVSRLTELGIKTRRGKDFNYHSLYRVLERTN